MAAAPTRWTDERLDDAADRLTRFEGNVDRRFDEVDRRFDRVDQRLDRVEAKLDRLIYTAWGGVAVAVVLKLLAG
jgi:hypothetical protein